MPLYDPWLPVDDPIPLLRAAAVVQVLRQTDDGWQILDNVACEWIEQREGTDPGNAAFRYKFTGNDPQAPQDAGSALNTAIVLPKTVEVFDRLVVQATRPDGVTEYLFDGYAMDFSLQMDGQVERVDFHALGRASSLWDSMIGGMLMRDASAPTGTSEYQTAVPAQFNPKGVGNATPQDADKTDGSFSYPIFIEPIKKVTAHPTRRWTLAMAAKYLIYHHNADEVRIYNPLPEDLDFVLVAREPIDGEVFDPNDPETYTATDIIVPDKPLTGRDWPSVLHELIRDVGFGMCFRLDNLEGDPRTSLDVFVQYAGEIKSVWLQAPGSTLDPRYSNMGAASVGRQTRDVINQWTVDGALTRYEASFILAPMFPMSSADGSTTTSIQAFDRSHPDFNTGGNRDAYRLYGIDEIGDGHYAVGTNTKLTRLPNLAGLLGPNYVIRYRRPKGDLITTDQYGRPIRYQLHYSTQYTGDVPGVWDGTVASSWKPITRGFELRHDRLGVWVNIDQPNSWTIGEDPVSFAPIVLKGVEAQCAVDASKNFDLMLTCVIEGDDAVTGTAEAQESSPVAYPIERRIDARDRYFKEIVAANSINNESSDPIVTRDDSDQATAEAIQNRASTEAGILDGTIVIPYLTTHYRIGDMISDVNGRNISFRTDTGTTSVPVFPVVVGRRWELGNGQRTTLYLSDEATDRFILERKARR